MQTYSSWQSCITAKMSRTWLERFLEHQPHSYAKCWPWLLGNPNVSWEEMEEHPEIVRFYSVISGNPNITPGHIMAHPDHPWYFDTLSANPSIPWEFIEAHPQKQWHKRAFNNLTKMLFGAPTLNFSWDYSLLSERIPWEVIAANPDKPWCWLMVALNESVTWDIVCANRFGSFPGGKGPIWFSSRLCFNPNITWEIIQANPANTITIGPWDYDVLCAHKCITWDIIRANSTLLNCHRFISRNPNITWDIVADNPTFPWDFNVLSRHPGMSWRIICENHDISHFTNATGTWNRPDASKNTSISWSDVEDISVYAGIQGEWDYEALSENSMGWTPNKAIMQRACAHVSRFRDELIMRYWERQDP